MHFDIDFNFIELMLETVEEWLLHSCRTILNSQGISLLYDGQVYRRYLQRVIRTSEKQIHLIFLYLAEVRLYTALNS